MTTDFPRRSSRRAGFALLAAAVATSCGRDAPAPPALHGIYRPVRVANSPSSADLMGVNGLDVDSRGNVYVADRSSQLLVFSPSGAVIRKLGRKGQGPGEFDWLQSVHVLPGDSVYAFDSGLSRVTVFGPRSDRAAYSVNVGTSAMLFPYWVHPASSTRSIFAAYRAAFGDGDGRGAHGHRREVLRILNPDGSVQRDSLVSFTESEMLFLHGAVEGVTYNPFGRQPVFAAGGGDRVYAAWTGALDVGVYSPDGRRVATIRPAVAVTPRPITARDRDSVVAALGRTVPPAAVRRAFAEVGSESWPLFREMVVDDAGRVWLGLLGRHGEPVHWTAFDASGARVASMDLPENVSLRVLRGRRAYGVELDADDVPRVVIYELQPAAPQPGRGA
ncbi:MAG: 6-bladed beta-propeller [Longimicrobiaceae bacterium]